MLARLEDGEVTWISRNGLDWTARFEALSPAIARLPAQQALIDGEIVVLDEHGVSRFHDLQKALGEDPDMPLTYFAFDLLFVDGLDLRRCALVDRKNVLRALLGRATKRSSVQFSAHIVGSGRHLVAQACRRDLEGIVSKRVDGSYASGRTRDWVKTKCGMRQEFVVVGYTQPTGSRVGIGSLVLGVHEKGKLRHAGRVGTGFGRNLLLKLRRELEPTAIARPPFAEPLDSAARRGVTWVKPKLVVEVTFTGWTGDGLLRHPSFEGLREDKKPSEVVKEAPKSLLRGSIGSARRAERDTARTRKNARRRA
jgi:bifunctional non-homologous end joining protein LigD